MLLVRRETEGRFLEADGGTAALVTEGSRTASFFGCVWVVVGSSARCLAFPVGFSAVGLDDRTQQRSEGWDPSSLGVLPVEAAKGCMGKGAMESVWVGDTGEGEWEATCVGDGGRGCRTGGRRVAPFEGISLST